MGEYEVAVLQRAISSLGKFTRCWLAYGGGCLMQRQYIVNMIVNVSNWLSYAGGALIKVADSAASTVLHEFSIKNVVSQSFRFILKVKC